MGKFNIGLDLGNGYVKYNGGLFKAKVRRGKVTSIAGIKKSKNVHQVIFENEEWVVGQGGSFTGKQRYFEESYKLSLYTGIALTIGDKPRNPIEVNLVVGLPIEYYEGKHEAVKEHIESFGVQEINVDGIDYVIEIKSVEVFIEGAYPILKNDDSHMITVDIGAGTVNIIEWKEQEIINKYTHNGSFNEKFTEIASLLNHKYDRTLNPEMIEDLIKEGSMETENGTVDIREDVDSVLSKWVGNILSYTTMINWEGAKFIKIFGGGALNTFSCWKNKFKKAELVPNCQAVNSEVYKAVAEALDEE